jgi:hypothetical protein
MNELPTCSRCGGFMNATASVCPHCDAPARSRRRLAVVLGLAGSASLGLTMMACYGGPPTERGDADNTDSQTNGDVSGPDGGAAN